MNKRSVFIGGLALVFVLIALILTILPATKTPVVAVVTEMPSTPITPPPESTHTPTPAESHPLIHVTVPARMAIITSPLTVTGEARGYWFFEASFPLELRDMDGNVLGKNIAQAQTEWMTEDFVPFSTTITFATTTATSGVLVLIKDNPSALPEHDDAFEIPVLFQK